MKFLLALVIGLGCGYYVGYSDGSTGKPSIAARAVGAVGGRSRSNVTNDIDATMEKLDDSKKPAKTP